MPNLSFDLNSRIIRWWNSRWKRLFNCKILW